MLDDARPGDLPVFGDVADENDRCAARFRVADQRLGTSAHLRDGARRRFDHMRIHGLDRIDDDQCRSPPLAQGRDNVLDIGGGREFHRGLRQAETDRTQTYLRDRLLARDIDDALAARRHGGAGLQQQRRLSDAGFAAEQQHRARHETTAGDAIEFGNAGFDARIRPALAGKAFYFDDAAGHGALGRACANAGSGRLLDDRVPLAAGFAAALPTVRYRAAVLADEVCARAGHACL